MKFTFFLIIPIFAVFSHAYLIEQDGPATPPATPVPHHQGEDASRWLVGRGGDHQEITRLPGSGVFQGLGMGFFWISYGSIRILSNDPWFR